VNTSRFSGAVLIDTSGKGTFGATTAITVENPPHETAYRRNFIYLPAKRRVTMRVASQIRTGRTAADVKDGRTKRWTTQFAFL